MDVQSGRLLTLDMNYRPTSRTSSRSSGAPEAWHDSIVCLGRSDDSPG